MKYINGKSEIQRSTDQIISAIKETKEKDNSTRKLPDFLRGDLPKKKKDLEDILKNLYEKLYDPHTGYPDWSHDNLIKERIKQAKFEISRIDAKSVKKREFIFLILAIIGTIFGVLSFIFK